MNYRKLKGEIKRIRKLAHDVNADSGELMDASFQMAKAASHRKQTGLSIELVNDCLLRSLAYHVVADEVAAQ